MELIDSLLKLESVSDGALLVALSSTRIAVACMLLPLFSSETVPPLVRNAVFMAFSVLVLALQPAVKPAAWGMVQWINLFGKEALLGMALGFGLAAFLWAFEAAGQIVDTKVGTSGLQLSDPMSGHQVSGSAALLGRFIGCIFMAGGGFMLLVGILLDSFRLWPVGHMTIAPRMSSLRLFEQQFNDLLSLSFLLASPALVLMFAIDMVLGLVNRYAPQINLMALTASLKGLAGTAVWMLMLASLAQGFRDGLARHLNALLPGLTRLLGS